MFLVRALTGSAAFALVVAASGKTVLAEESPSAACAGTHGLWSPLPDSCLNTLDTDRPHQTDTPHVVPAGHVQLESALAEAQWGGPRGTLYGDRNTRLLFFDNNYKFGLVSNVDLQLLFLHAAYDLSQRALLPPGPLQVRAKFNVIQENGWVPALTLVPWVFLPVAPSAPLRGGPLVFWGWELPAHFELEMNAGVLFSANPKPPAALVLASALTYKPLEAFGVFVDIYATGPDVAFGTGMLWAITRDMQLDLGTYVGIRGEEPIAAPFLGFSIRR